MSATHRARKRFGQNFLRDQSIIDRIVQHIAPKMGDNILEIGPGQGAITSQLVASDADVYAVEIDNDLARGLNTHFVNADNFTLFNTDALKFDLNSIELNSNSSANENDARLFKVVGNLPYNISTPLLFHLLSFRAHISDMVFMLQNEVVERMEAAPGSKTYGRLSVILQYYCRVESLLAVPPSAFSPQPKVQSAVVRLVPLPESEREAVNADTLEMLVRLAFAQRRKTLRNNLKTVLSDEAIENCGVDPSTRAEQLTVDEFVQLAKAIG